MQPIDPLAEQARESPSVNCNPALANDDGKRCETFLQQLTDHKSSLTAQENQDNNEPPDKSHAIGYALTSLVATPLYILEPLAELVEVFGRNGVIDHVRIGR